MKVLDEKVVTLKRGDSKVKVKVYTKEVLVRNNNHIVKAFCKIIGEN